MSATKNKRLSILQSLIYPAFLGAALYEFAHTLMDSPASAFAAAPEWLPTMAWFLTYFVAAYMVLLEPHHKPYTWIAFCTTIAELAIVLWVSLRINQQNEVRVIGPDTDRYIYLSWLAIPVIAFIGNASVERPIKTTITLLAIAVAGGAFLAELTEAWPYPVVLALMWALLVAYLVQTACMAAKATNSQAKE